MSELPLQPPDTPPLPWIGVAKDVPYFVTEWGEPWTPVGQNDAVTWVDLAGLFRRKNITGVGSIWRFQTARRNGSALIAGVRAKRHSKPRNAPWGVSSRDGQVVGEFRPVRTSRAAAATDAV